MKKQRRMIVTIGALDDALDRDHARRFGPPPIVAAQFQSGAIDEMMAIGAADDDSRSLDLSAYNVPISTALAIPEPGPTGSSSSSTSGKGWARCDGTYVLQSGDTLSKIAALYLGSASRYPEIWALQSAAYKAGHTVDRVNAGDVLAMPPAAFARAKALGLCAAAKPAVVVAPPGLTPAPVAIAPKANHHLLLGGLGVAMSAGLGMLLWVPPSKKARSRARRARR